jgi:outer membrane receptor protein involved in Fe transport
MGELRARAEVAAFHNRIDDFIFIAPTGQQQGNLQGIATSTRRDAERREVSADFDPARMVTLRARYDMVRGTNEDTDEPLPLIPPPRTTLEAELHGVGLGWAEHAHAGFDVEINSEQTRLGTFDTATDGYTLLGLDAGIARHLGSHPIRFDIRVRNLTDQAYKSYPSRYKSFALDPGRNVLVDSRRSSSGRAVATRSCSPFADGCGLLLLATSCCQYRPADRDANSRDDAGDETMLAAASRIVCAA